MADKKNPNSIEEKRKKLQDLLRDLLTWEGHFVDIQTSFSRLRSEFIELTGKVKQELEE